MSIAQSLSLSPVLPVQKFLTASGDGLGTYNHNGNYSSAPVDMYYQATTQYDIYSFLISISDDSTFNQTDYGGIAVGTVLNGVGVYYWSHQYQAERALLSGVKFKFNYQWFAITAGVGLTTFAGTPQTLRINFDLNQDYGCPFRLNTGDKFIVRLNDNFTGLVSHTFGLRGSMT